MGLSAGADPGGGGGGGGVWGAEAERTFSLLRRIKTYTRSTLTEDHFSDLAVMAMHY